MYVLDIFSQWNQIGIDMDHLSEPRWGFDDFSLFFGNFGSNLAFFRHQMTLTTLKLAYYHAPMYVLGIYYHLTQYKDE